MLAAHPLTNVIVALHLPFFDAGYSGTNPSRGPTAIAALVPATCFRNLRRVSGLPKIKISSGPSDDRSGVSSPGSSSPLELIKAPPRQVRIQVPGSRRTLVLRGSPQVAWSRGDLSFWFASNLPFL